MLGIIIKEEHAKMYQNETDAAGVAKPSRMQVLGIRNADTVVDKLFLPGHPDNSPQFQVSIYKKRQQVTRQKLVKQINDNQHTSMFSHNKPNTRG